MLQGSLDETMHSPDMDSAATQAPPMHPSLDSLPLELLRLVVDNASRSVYDRQRMRARLVMVNKALRRLLLDDVRTVIWVSKRWQDKAFLPDKNPLAHTATTLIASAGVDLFGHFNHEAATGGQFRAPADAVRESDAVSFVSQIPALREVVFEGLDANFIIRRGWWDTCQTDNDEALRGDCQPVEVPIEVSFDSPWQKLTSISFEQCFLYLQPQSSPALIRCEHLVFRGVVGVNSDSLDRLLNQHPLHLPSLQAIRLCPVLSTTDARLGRDHIPAMCKDLLEQVEAVQIECTWPHLIQRSVNDLPIPPPCYFETQTPVLLRLDHLFDVVVRERYRRHPGLGSYYNRAPHANPNVFRRARFIQLGELEYEALPHMAAFLATCPSLRAVFLWRRLDPNKVDKEWASDARALVTTLEEAGVDVVFTDPDTVDCILPEFMQYIRRHDLA
ncbi:hypothetical protein JCM10908_001936 [Rhodotorula pacifica]|uniref:uncharacterized protein n=1 Tax=Rhodotorula pacifica TaxID=1495444 RepID=UPI00317DD096